MNYEDETYFARNGYRKCTRCGCKNDLSALRCENRMCQADLMIYGVVVDPDPSWIDGRMPPEKDENEMRAFKEAQAYPQEQKEERLEQEARAREEEMRRRQAEKERAAAEEAARRAREEQERLKSEQEERARAEYEKVYHEEQEKLRREKEALERERRRKEEARRLKEEVCVDPVRWQSEEQRREWEEKMKRRQEPEAGECPPGKKEQEKAPQMGRSGDAAKPKKGKSLSSTQICILVAIGGFVFVLVAVAADIDAITVPASMVMFIGMIGIPVSKAIETHKDKVVWKAAGLKWKRKFGFHKFGYLFQVRNADFASVRDELNRQQEQGLRLNSEISTDAEEQDCLNFKGKTWTANLKLLQTDGVSCLYYFWFTFIRLENGSPLNAKAMSVRLSQVENLFMARDPGMTEQVKEINIKKV